MKKPYLRHTDCKDAELDMEKGLTADKIPSFATLSDEERRALSDILVVQKVRKKQMVVKDGQVCHYMFYVCKGLLRQFYLKTGVKSRSISLARATSPIV